MHVARPERSVDLDELRAFLALADTGSFLAAADALSLSRTTLRRRIDALEARVGVPLLLRSATGAVLTDAGRTLAARGRPLVQEATALLTSVREVGAVASGVLRVVMPAGLPPHALVPLFGAMRATYPLMHVETRVTDDPLGGALEDFDLAAHIGPRIPDGPWVTRVLTRLRVHLIASAEYLARCGTPETVDDLHRHELLGWRRPGADSRAWPLVMGGEVRVQPALISPDVHFLRQLAIAGHGIAFLPDGMLPDPGIDPELLVPVLPDVVRETVSLRVVVPEVLAKSPRVRAILESIDAIVE